MHKCTGIRQIFIFVKFSFKIIALCAKYVFLDLLCRHVCKKKTRLILQIHII